MRIVKKSHLYKKFFISSYNATKLTLTKKPFECLHTRRALIPLTVSKTNRLNRTNDKLLNNNYFMSFRTGCRRRSPSAVRWKALPGPAAADGTARRR